MRVPFCPSLPFFCRTQSRRVLSLVLFLLWILFAPWAAAASAAVHTHASPDGLETVVCSCRPATGQEAADLRLSPEGWMQDEPRASFSRGTVPYALVPDWVATRIRATGGLAWGDADHDGDLDLAVGTYFASMYPPIIDYYNFIYLSDGGALEATPSWISSDQRHSGDVEWGDINGDSYVDLFAANGGESLQQSQVFYGRDGLLPNTAGWTSNVSCWTIDAALADFDNDHDLDVATANQGNSANPYRPTYLFRNTGTGLQSTPWWQSNQIGITNSADWGDVNGDGLLDLAVAGWVGWQSGVFLNLGMTLDPGFSWTTGHPERTDKGIGWSDVDGDLDMDLLVGGNGAPDWLFPNLGSFLGAQPVWASGDAYHGCQELVWADVDGDGDEDLASVHFSTGHFRIYLNEGGVLPTVADWQYDAASSATALDFGDLNGDGRLDLAVGVANGPVAVFLNTGPPAGQPETAEDLPRPGQVRFTAGPNPFSETIRFGIQSAEPVAVVSIEIWDVSGRSVGRIPPESGGTLARSGLARTATLDYARPVGEPPLPAGIYLARAILRDASGRLSCPVVRIVHAGH